MNILTQNTNKALSKKIECLLIQNINTSFIKEIKCVLEYLVNIHIDYTTLSLVITLDLMNKYNTLYIRFI